MPWWFIDFKIDFGSSGARIFGHEAQDSVSRALLCRRGRALLAISALAADAWAELAAFRARAFREPDWRIFRHGRNCVRHRPSRFHAY